MLAHQKSRVVKLEESRKILDKDMDIEILGEFNGARFEKAMEGFEPTGSFERKLALGVL